MPERRQRQVHITPSQRKTLEALQAGGELPDDPATRRNLRALRARKLVTVERGKKGAKAQLVKGAAENVAAQRASTSVKSKG